MLRANAKCVIACLVGLLAATHTLAQDSSVLQAPSPIAFPDWEFVRDNESGLEYRIDLPSAFESGIPVNDRFEVVALLPKRREGPVPVVVLLHYWGAVDLGLERRMALRLNDRGIAAVLIELPYHLGRTPEGARSGELAVQADPDNLRATMLQSVLDVKRTVDWIESHPEFDADRIGIGGTSLGAIVASLAFAVEPRFQCATFTLGGVDLAGILWSSSRAVRQRDAMRRRGITLDSLRESLASVEPLEFLPQSPPRPALVIGARYDTVVPRRSTQALVDALDDPAVLWLDTGHYGGVFVEREILRASASFFESSLRGGEFRVPSGLYSPTLRVGFHLSGEKGGQIALGLDLWRMNAEGDAFATALMTPVGPAGFVGFRASSNLALGVTIWPRETTWGVYWNFVL